MTPTAVAVCIIGFRQRDDVLGCLRSLARVQCPALRAVVLDNASEDGTAEVVTASHPNVELIVSPRNLGFAAGANRLLAHAFRQGADAAVLLNPDTEVDPAFVDALLRAGGARRDAAAVCSKILFLDRPDRIWYAGARLDPRRGYQGRHDGFSARDGARFAAVRETGRACAGAMLVTKEVWERMGGFDERLFLYWEDADWSLRARKLGLRIYVAGESRVWHRVSSASGGEGAPNALYYSTRNGLWVLERHAPLGWARTWRRRGAHLCALTLQALRTRQKRRGLQAILHGWRDFRAARLGPRGPLRQRGPGADGPC